MCLCENLLHHHHTFDPVFSVLDVWIWCSLLFDLEQWVMFHSLVFSCLCVSDYVVYLWFRLILGSLSVWSSVSCLHAYVPPCVCLALFPCVSLSLSLIPVMSHCSVSLNCSLFSVFHPCPPNLSWVYMLVSLCLIIKLTSWCLCPGVCTTSCFILIVLV